MLTRAAREAGAVLRHVEQTARDRAGDDRCARLLATKCYFVQSQARSRFWCKATCPLQDQRIVTSSSTSSLAITPASLEVVY